MAWEVAAGVAAGRFVARYVLEVCMSVQLMRVLLLRVGRVGK